MVGTGAKVLLMIFFMHTFLFLGVESVRPQIQPYVEDFGRVVINESENLTAILTQNTTLEDFNITAGTGTIAGGVNIDFNPVGAGFGLLTFLWAFISSPVALLSLDIPFQIKLIFLAPLTMLYVLAVAGWLRGKDL